MVENADHASNDRVWKRWCVRRITHRGVLTVRQDGNDQSNVSCLRLPPIPDSKRIPTFPQHCNRYVSDTRFSQRSLGRVRPWCCD